MIKSVAVYLGSATVAERYHRLAYDFGHGLAERGIRVVYGGAAVGTIALRIEAIPTAQRTTMECRQGGNTLAVCL